VRAEKSLLFLLESLFRFAGNQEEKHPMNQKESIQFYRAEILKVAQRYGAISLKVFGSVVRGDETDSSDVDFLIEMDSSRSLFDLGGLQYDLQRLLGCRVDVVTEKGLHWFIRDRILREAVAI
jgi:predicted nucleotidyltransferase